MDKKFAFGVLQSHEQAPETFTTLDQARDLMNAHLVTGADPANSVIHTLNRIVPGHPDHKQVSSVQWYKGSWRFISAFGPADTDPEESEG